MFGRKPNKVQLKGLMQGWKYKNIFEKGHIPWNKGLKGYKSGEKNSLWKGEKVSYSGLHKFLARYKLKSKKCDFCQKEKKLELARKKNVNYSRNPNDWYYLCIKCHRKYDSDKYIKGWKKRRKKEKQTHAQAID